MQKKKTAANLILIFMFIIMVLCSFMTTSCVSYANSTSGKIDAHVQKYLRVGNRTRITYKTRSISDKVKFKSEDPDVAKVSSTGLVRALKPGKAKITITSKADSEVKDSVTVTTFELTKEDTKWIAHKGYHRKDSGIKENTAKAYKKAGELGFYGCECDVRVTKDGKFVMSHDDSLYKVFKTGKRISKSSYSSLKKTRKLKELCTFSEYINICNRYSMVPVIEFKGNWNSRSIKRLAKIIKEKSGNEGLKKAWFLSTNKSQLGRTKKIVKKMSGSAPKCVCVIQRWERSNICSKVRSLKKNGYKNIALSKFRLNDSISRECKKQDMDLNIWTSLGKSWEDPMLYKAFKSHKYKVDSVTTEVKIFD